MINWLRRFNVTTRILSLAIFFAYRDDRRTDIFHV